MISELPNRIKQLRGHLKVNQDAFAQKIGVHKQTLSKYERGIIEPTAGVLSQIAYSCSVDLAWLIVGSGEMFAKKELGGRERQTNLDPTIMALSEWLEEVSMDEPGRREWFRIEMMDKFPAFREFMKRKDPTAAEVDLGQQSKKIA